MAARLGVSARVTVLTAAELVAAVGENPLPEIATDPSRLLVAVLSHPDDRLKLEPLMEQDWSPDVLAVGTRVAYAWCAEGVLASRLLMAISRALGDAVTTRNWATMKKLQALIDEGD